MGEESLMLQTQKGESKINRDAEMMLGYIHTVKGQSKGPGGGEVWGRK
jgi:hypothetical protein